MYILCYVITKYLFLVPLAPVIAAAIDLWVLTRPWQKMTTTLQSTNLGAYIVVYNVNANETPTQHCLLSL